MQMTKCDPLTAYDSDPVVQRLFDATCYNTAHVASFVTWHLSHLSYGPYQYALPQPFIGVEHSATRHSLCYTHSSTSPASCRYVKTFCLPLLRRYMTGLRRVVQFMQLVRPNADPSKHM